MDEIDDLLTPRASPPEPARRDELRTRTAGVVRRRRWRGRARWALALAACYAAGAGTLWLSQPRTAPPPSQPEVIVQTPTENLTPIPRLPRKAESPELLERQAALAKGERGIELYRRAGDVFLDRGDERSALRCYRNSLDRTRPSEVLISPENDTWLLMSLKMARQRETSDARN